MILPAIRKKPDASEQLGGIGLLNYGRTFAPLTSMESTGIESFVERGGMVGKLAAGKGVAA